MDTNSIQFDHGPNGYPRSLNRLQAEIYLLADPNTTKQVIEIPSEHIDAKLAKALATRMKLKLLKEGDAYYLSDPKINSGDLRTAIQNGEHGEYLGHPCKSCPEEGVDYAVSTDGEGSTDPHEILEWRNSDKLGWAGRAPDENVAAEKMAEIGQSLKPKFAPQGENIGLSMGRPA